MGPLLRAGYAAAGHLARALAQIAPDGEHKVARSLRGRRGIRGRYADWGATERDPARPLLWIHAPSVGEGLQARPVIELLRHDRPDLQLAYTYFSPSAAPFASRLPVDFRDLLPFDTRGDMTHALEALRPSAIVFSKLDVWPTLTAAAARRGVRLGLISATLAASSSRRSRFAAALLRDAYARLDAVGAIDAQDAGRLVGIGVRREAISVTGDTRYDQVWARARSVDRARPPVAPLLDDRPTLVAGSTWPADEQPLLAAWTRVRAGHPGARLVIAPHEPTPRHLTPIERWGDDAGLTVRRIDAADAAAADVVVVDRVGILGDLYAVGDIALVGGGFHAAGLHSVLEPAAFGLPILFGPRHQNARDAQLLIDAGAAAAVGGADDLVARLDDWMSHPAARAAAGARAQRLVEEGRGAARRSLALIDRLLPPRR